MIVYYEYDSSSLVYLVARDAEDLCVDELERCNIRFICRHVCKFLEIF